MVRLLNEAARFSRLTEGAFDVTVQPLWQLHAEHFARPGADPAGPPTVAIEAVYSLVDYRALRIEEDRISFSRRGMAATLNGIAQGYITDRVADRLRAEGMTRVLVDMGEVLAMGAHPDGRPWRVALPAGDDVRVMAVRMMAVRDSPAFWTSRTPPWRRHRAEPRGSIAAGRFRTHLQSRYRPLHDATAFGNRDGIQMRPPPTLSHCSHGHA